MELVFKCIVPILKIITRCKVTTMANYKDLCRLCATNTDFFKNVFDENNKNILKMIQDFIQISITESDDLPKNICLNCEEKMVTFQLFVLECYKAQEILKLFKNKTDVEVKYEQCSDNESIKSEGKLLEVKNEMINEDLAQVMNNQELSETLSSSYLMYDVDNDNFAEDFDDEKEDNEEDLSLALLKEIKTKKIKDKADNFINIETLQIIIQKPNFKARDIISFDCVICNEKLKSWNTVQYHYIEVHKSRPFVICMCGQDIKSQNKLYKHVADHKLEGKKLREQADNDSTLEEEMNVKVKDFVRFTCHECETECSSWYKLSAHCRTIHQTAAIVKCTCGIVLRSKTVMYRHIHEHKTPNTLACDKCPRITNSIAALNKHKQRHVPKSDRKYCCSSCDKIFTTKDAVRSHEKSHIPIEDRKIYCCDVCSLKFTTRSSAMSHKRVVHDKIKSYVCDLCGYACGTNGELTQHRAIHSADKPFVCKKCSKPFKTYSNLKTHMDTHEDTAYECYVCRRILNSRRTLRKHLLVHEDKFRHTCSYCNKGFKRRQTLKVHMYTHTGDKPLSCKWCSERFSYASTLRSHRLRCHADKLAPPNDYTLSYDQHAAANTNFIKQVSIIPGSMSVSKNEVEAI